MRNFNASNRVRMGKERANQDMDVDIATKLLQSKLTLGIERLTSDLDIKHHKGKVSRVWTSKYRATPENFMLSYAAFPEGSPDRPTARNHTSLNIPLLPHLRFRIGISEAAYLSCLLGRIRIPVCKRFCMSDAHHIRPGRCRWSDNCGRRCADGGPKAATRPSYQRCCSSAGHS